MFKSQKLKKTKGLRLKYRLRSVGVPVLARIGHLLGIDWRELGEKLGREVLIEQLRSLGPAQAMERVSKPLDVIFLTMMGGNHGLSSVEVVLDRALKARGHRVRYVLCDQMLPACEVKWQDQEYRWAQACAKCYEFGKRYLCQTGCEVIAVSELIKDASNSDDWSECIESALLKHYHVGVLANQPAVLQRRKLFAQAAGVSAAVGTKLAEMKPDRVVMSHGIYCTWGPAREMLLRAGIPVITYAGGKKKDTEKFNWTSSADWWDVSKEWEGVKDVPLTERQKRIIDDYLESRRSHNLDARVYNLGQEETIEQSLERLKLNPNRQIFVLFTNVLWDAASAQREIVFRNPIEWVMETIAWFAEHPDRQLVVKIHPAEIVIGTKQPFASLIAERFPELPENVRVIEPQEKVNSWSIMRVADLGLVHTSTVGMELPLEGIPCAVVSRTHYRDRGFTIDINSRREYFELIENWGKSRMDRDQLKALSKRYAYLLFERYQLPFPFLHGTSVNDVRALLQVREEELLAHQTIRIFLRGLENQEEFLLPA